MKLSLFTDGGSRGNPGPAAIGVVACKVGSGMRQSGQSVHDEIAHRARCIGKATNNVAEYHALIDGLELCKELGATEIACYCDSELVVNQMVGNWKVRKPHLKELKKKALKLMVQFNQVSFRWLSRENEWIKRADELLNEELDNLKGSS